jgi:hypothetical protein
MRSISKRALAALAITAAVVALTAASASAAEAHYGQWWVSGAQFTGTSSTETSVSKSIVIAMTIGGIKTEVVCSGGSGAGTIAETDKGTTSPGLELTGCKVPVSIGSCTVASTLKTGVLNVALNTESEVTYTTTGGAPFFSVTLSGTACAVEGAFKVTGSLRCSVGSPFAEAAEKTCTFIKGFGSEVKFGTNSATVEGALTSKLSGTYKGDPWAVGEGSGWGGDWWVEGAHIIGKEKESLHVSSTGPVTFTGALLGIAGEEISCESLGAESASISPGDEGKIKPTLSGCKMTKPSSCSIAGSLGELQNQNGVVEPAEGGAVYYKLGTSESTLVVFKVSGCGQEGNYTLKGALRCKFAEPLLEAVVKPCAFSSTSGSTLKSGANAIVFTATMNMELAGADKGKKWTAGSTS